MKNLIWIVVLLLIVGIGVFIATSRQGEAPTINDQSTMADKLSITSSAFEDEEAIPSRFTCDGENINPELVFSGVPEDAKSLTLIMDDPDIPDEVKGRLGREDFVHWVAFNIDPDTEKIEEGSAPQTEGVNSSGAEGYTGPCPPTEFEPTEHRYFFKLFALDSELPLSAGATKEDLLDSMEGKVLEEASLMGTYDRAE